MKKKPSLLDLGAALFWAQPFGLKRSGWDSFKACCRTTARSGYRAGAQIPVWVDKLFNLSLASKSKTYCDELKGKAAELGCPISSLANHLHTNLVVVSPTYRAQLSLFAPKKLHFGSINQLQTWAD